MRRLHYALLTMALASFMIAGCGDKETGGAVAEGTTGGDALSEIASETTTVGIEEISGNLNFTGESVVEAVHTEVSEYGNSAGNLINSGIVCEAGGRIYYYNKSDNKRLYSMNKDGSEKKAFGDIQGAVELNVSGDYLYYQNGGIYKAGIKDASVTRLVEDNCRNMVVSGQYIYYIKADGDVSKVHRINTDGTDEAVLSDNIAGGLNVYGGSVYYINGSDSGKIYRIIPDAGSDDAMFDNRNVKELLVDESGIYFTGSDGKLYKGSFEGGAAELIVDAAISNININGGFLYYYNEDDQTLCVNTTDGSGPKVLYSGSLNAVNVITDWVYFFNTDDFLYYRITKDGNNIEIVE